MGHFSHFFKPDAMLILKVAMLRTEMGLETVNLQESIIMQGQHDGITAELLSRCYHLWSLQKKKKLVVH